MTVTPKLSHGLGTRIKGGSNILGSNFILNQVHIFTFQIIIKEINETNKYMMNVKSKSKQIKSKSNQNTIEIKLLSKAKCNV